MIESIAGLPRPKQPAPSFGWYCVRALVAIQIEGQTGGLQSIEDLFVVVRAKSFGDAERRLRSKWREYATPYLNSDSRLVRWQFQKVTDVYEIHGDEIDPNGTEVYSRLSSRQIKPARQWHPRKELQ